MKKILLSLIVIAAVSAAVVKGTQALFSDTETSDDNTFAAGTLDLKVDGQDDPTIVSVSLANMKPGDTQTYNWTLSNSGSLDGQPYIEIINVVDYDNNCTEPETNVPDITCGDPGAGEGELSDNLYVTINAAGSGGYEYPNGPGCINGGRTCPLSYWQSYGLVGNGSPTTWEQIPASSSIAPMQLIIEIPSSIDNIIQSDSLEFDIVFHLDQV